MKLELKHLTPYLPYGLEIMFNKKYKGELVGLFASKWNLAEVKFKFGNDRKDIEVCYPILRPLSDLTTDTEFRLDRVIYKCTGDEFEYNRYKKSTNEIVLNATNGSAYYYSLCFEDLNCISYTFIVNLISLHFDVFGLIEKGLAIDINTIK